MKPTIISRPLFSSSPFLANAPKSRGPAALLFLAYMLFAWIPENRLTAQNPTSQDSFDPEAIHYRIEFHEAAIQSSSVYCS